MILARAIVGEQVQQRRLVAMAMQIEVALDREIDDLLDQRAGRGVAGDVEFADAAVVAALVFVLDQVEGRRDR